MAKKSKANRRRKGANQASDDDDYDVDDSVSVVSSSSVASSRRDDDTRENENGTMRRGYASERAADNDSDNFGSGYSQVEDKIKEAIDNISDKSVKIRAKGYQSLIALFRTKCVSSVLENRSLELQLACERSLKRGAPPEQLLALNLLDVLVVQLLNSGSNSGGRSRLSNSSSNQLTGNMFETLVLNASLAVAVSSSSSDSGCMTSDNSTLTLLTSVIMDRTATARVRGQAAASFAFAVHTAMEAGQVADRSVASCCDMALRTIATLFTVVDGRSASRPAQGRHVLSDGEDRSHSSSSASTPSSHASSESDEAGSGQQEKLRVATAVANVTTAKQRKVHSDGRLKLTPSIASDCGGGGATVDMARQALDAWSLVASALSPRAAANYLVRYAPVILALLNTNDIELRIVTGQAFATLFEAAESFIVDSDSTENDGTEAADWDVIVAVIGRITELCRESHKFRSKKDRKEQRTTFRDISRFIEHSECTSVIQSRSSDGQIAAGANGNDEASTNSSESSDGGVAGEWELAAARSGNTYAFNVAESLHVTTWAERRQYECLRRVLASGVNAHLTENVGLRRIFGLGPPRLDIIGGGCGASDATGTTAGLSGREKKSVKSERAAQLWKQDRRRVQDKRFVH